MGVICIGLLGFAVLFLYDLATLRKLRGRTFLAAAGYSINVYAIAAAALGDNDLVISWWAVCIGWFLAIVGSGWLLYCLVLFPPIMRTYLEVKGPVLTTEGPYALSRHPGVYGYILFISGLILASRSSLLLKSSIAWIICNMVYVIIQDRWVFPRLFEEYREYMKKTPMIFPNIKSIKEFIKYYTA